MKSIPLENGYHAFFYDQSRTIAGDRLLVQLLLDIPIPVNSSDLERIPSSRASSEAFISECDSELHYHLIKTRHFVPAPEKTEVLSQLEAELQKTVLPYLGHPDFGRNFILKTYQEWLNS